MSEPLPTPRMLTVAIDGPGGAGKSTLASALADRLGLERLDSGAMYRALALVAIRAGVDLTDGATLGRLAGELRLGVAGSSVMLDGEDVSAAIRTDRVTRAASVVSVHPLVRAELVSRQRAWIAERGGGVVEGRDIGTVVCPDADLKIFLTAHASERARRRAAELRLAAAEAVAADLALRDHHDSNRAVSPLEVAPGAVVIDTTNRSVLSLVEQVMEMLSRSGGGG